MMKKGNKIKFKKIKFKRKNGQLKYPDFNDFNVLLTYLLELSPLKPVNTEAILPYHLRHSVVTQIWKIGDPKLIYILVKYGRITLRVDDELMKMKMHNMKTDLKKQLR